MNARIPKHRHLTAKGIRITKGQQSTLVWLRRLYGENGFFIYPVATWYRRSRHDFIAYPKDDPNMLVIVRPTRQGKIELRSYVLSLQYTLLTKKIRARKEKPCHVIWGKQLPALFHSYGTDWRWFFPRRYWQEIGISTS
jgi:hypothetical protein